MKRWIEIILESNETFKIGDKIKIVKNNLGGLPLSTAKTKIIVGTTGLITEKPKVHGMSGVMAVIKFDSSGEEIRIPIENIEQI
jgi:hypothetical protein